MVLKYKISKCKICFVNKSKIRSIKRYITGKKKKKHPQRCKLLVLLLMLIQYTFFFVLFSSAFFFFLGWKFCESGWFGADFVWSDWTSKNRTSGEICSPFPKRHRIRIYVFSALYSPFDDDVPASAKKITVREWRRFYKGRGDSIF